MSAENKQRILELAPGEQWSPLHEQVNDLLILEKKARQENDANKSADVCKQIVSAFKVIKRFSD